MKHGNIILLVSLVFTHCCVYDPPPPTISICNESKESVKITVHYNKSILNEFVNVNPYSELKSYTGDYYGNCINVVDFDTIDLIGSYIIAPDCRFSLRLNGAIEPPFKFSSMEIISGLDTLNVTASTDSLYAFKKMRWQQYELRIN